MQAVTQAVMHLRVSGRSPQQQAQHQGEGGRGMEPVQAGRLVHDQSQTVEGPGLQQVTIRTSFNQRSVLTEQQSILGVTVLLVLCSSSRTLPVVPMGPVVVYWCTWTSGEVWSWLRVNRTPRQVERCWAELIPPV